MNAWKPCFNIALGRVVELYNRVDTQDPSTSRLTVVAVAAGTTSDANFKDFDTLAQCLPGSGGSAEVGQSGYARKTLTEADIAAFAPTDASDLVQVTIPDQTWTAVASGGSAWTDLIICYNPTNGADSTIVPMTLHDFAVTTDGSDVIADVGSSGFFQAS